MPDEKAFQIIEDVKGSELCPDCVDLFFTIKKPAETEPVEVDEVTAVSENN